MKKWMIGAAAALSIATVNPAIGQTGGHVTCTGILISVDLKPQAAFPMAVVYDDTDIS